MSDLYRCECGKLVYLGLDTMGHARECEYAAKFMASLNRAETSDPEPEEPVRDA